MQRACVGICVGGAASDCIDDLVGWILRSISEAIQPLQHGRSNAFIIELDCIDLQCRYVIQKLGFGNHNISEHFDKRYRNVKPDRQGTRDGR